MAARHFGLHGMGERAAALGGRLEVRSKDGEGTVVDLSIPARRGVRRAPSGNVLVPPAGATTHA